MSKLEELQTFIQYIAENSDVKVIKEFPARATLAYKPPMFFRTLPLGSVILYPNYLVFLTLDGSSPGYGLLFGELFGKFKALKNVYDWVTDPKSIVEFLVEYLPEHISGSQAEKALGNSNSFFIPLNNLKVVSPYYNWSQGHYIRIMTGYTNIVICQDALIDQRQDYFGSMVKMFNPATYRPGSWHSDLLSYLRAKKV